MPMNVTTSVYWAVFFAVSIAGCILGHIFGSTAAVGLGIAGGVISLAAVSL